LPLGCNPLSASHIQQTLQNCWRGISRKTFSISHSLQHCHAKRAKQLQYLPETILRCGLYYSDAHSTSPFCHPPPPSTMHIPYPCCLPPPSLHVHVHACISAG
jgi:hypothetical protein